jgi:hypothetical protein
LEPGEGQDGGRLASALQSTLNHAMAGSATHRIFLSAVTRELGSYRSEVARVLRRGEVEVREQFHFRQGPATLLERLRDYIEQCDAVILLIGDRCGAFPTEEHAAVLGPVPAFEVYRKATGRARASFTQWEYFLAKQYGKRIYIFLTAAGCVPDEPNSEDAALQACQAAYREWLEASGKHYDSFATKAQLVEHVLVVQASRWSSRGRSSIALRQRDVPSSTLLLQQKPAHRSEDLQDEAAHRRLAMAESGFPKSVEDVIATLVEIYRYQRRSDIIELLESANARIEEINYDNWNGGTYTYTLMLDVPVFIFAAVETKLAEIESSIASKLSIISRDLSNEHLDSVTIVPLTSKSAILGPKAKPAEFEVKHLWVETYFRLFLSHVSAHKASVARLKSELRFRGISAFIAHEDIKPSLEWQNQIELALRSMHALAALMTPDFHVSNWTDQEVGFALGTGALVVPVRLGLDPYGFIGKTQGLSGSLEDPSSLADSILNTLLNHSLTRRHARKGLAFAFAAAPSASCAVNLSKVIITVMDFTEDEKSVIERACKDNDQVLNATGVVSQIYTAIGVREPTMAGDVDDIPF